MPGAGDTILAVPSAVLTPVSPAQVDHVVDVFADAFSGYPVMRFTVGDEGDVSARERRLVRLFVERRVARGGPMFGVRASEWSEGSQASEFDGAILLTIPEEPPPGPEIAEISAAAWRELGEDARLRYDDYTRASNFFSDYGPHLHLNMIGVRRVRKGSGLGRLLLDAVRQLADDNPAYSGVSLTTENPRNVDLYQHFGYEVVGEGQFGGNLKTWGMFLRIR